MHCFVLTTFFYKLESFSFSGYVAIYIRHYFLLERSKTQKELLDINKKSDKELIDVTMRRLKSLQWISFESGAWILYVGHGSLILVVLVLTAVNTTQNNYTLGSFNPYIISSMVILLVQLVSSSSKQHFAYQNLISFY